MHDSTLHTLHAGLLHVRVTGCAQLTRDLDYSWATFNQSARPLDWIALTMTETTFQHVRLHQLTRDDSLSYFMATLSSIPAARGIILINTDNSHLLSAKKLNLGGGGGGEGGGGEGGGGEERCSPVPVLVVTREIGAELLRLVAEYPRGVEVKVDVSNGAMSTQSSWSELAGMRTSVVDCVSVSCNAYSLLMKATCNKLEAVVSGPGIAGLSGPTMTVFLEYQCNYSTTHCISYQAYYITCTQWAGGM